VGLVASEARLLDGRVSVLGRSGGRSVLRRLGQLTTCTNIMQFVLAVLLQAVEAGDNGNAGGGAEGEGRGGAVGHAGGAVPGGQLVACLPQAGGAGGRGSLPAGRGCRLGPHKSRITHTGEMVH
jgi:hypothetical protein